MNAGALRSVAVVGDGVAAWTSAAALRRQVPGLGVMLIAARNPVRDVADRIATTAPISRAFHASIGLDDADIVRQTRGAWRLGSRMRGPAGAYVRSYGPVGRTVAGLSFVAAWRLAASDQDFASFAPGAVLGLAGRLPDDSRLLAEVGVGLSLDAAAYRAFMMAYAKHLGVVFAGRLGAVERDGAQVTALTLDDGSTLTADIYVDATGDQRRLAGDRVEWEDWRDFLPVDRLRVFRRPARARSALDRAELTDMWRVSSVVDAEWHAVAYPVAREEAALSRAGSDEDPACPIVPGRRRDALTGNVVAVGDAYACLAPVDAAPLSLLHAQLDLLVRRLPGRDFAPVELRDLNREMNLAADSLRDFQAAQVPGAVVPATLADTRARFADRGRWRQRDGEQMDQGDWAQVLIGTGYAPQRLDTLARAADEVAVARALAEFRMELRTAVARAPALPGFNRKDPT